MLWQTPRTPGFAAAAKAVKARLGTRARTQENTHTKTRTHVHLEERGGLVELALLAEC